MGKNVLIYGLSGDRGKVPLAIDRVTDAIVVISEGHSRRHSEDNYFAVYSALADTDGSIMVRIQTPNTTKWAHMSITMDSALAGTAEMWTNSTSVHVGGNAITPMQVQMNSLNVSGLTICHTPTSPDGGAAHLKQYIGSASSGGSKNVSSGQTGSRGEFILKQNSVYLIKLTSRADANAISIILDWYELVSNNEESTSSESSESSSTSSVSSESSEST